MNKLISTDVRVFMCICGSAGSGKTRLILELLTCNSNKGGIFLPRFEKIVYYYRYWQPIYKLFQEKLPGQIFFRNCKAPPPSSKNNNNDNINQNTKDCNNKPKSSSPNSIARHYNSGDIDSLIENLLNHQSAESGFRTDKNNEKILAIFDDSCDEILESLSFANLATAGRHKGVSVIFIKHNLYHQGRYCVTVDKNTTHLVILKSPRISKQLRILGSELEFADSNFLQAAYQYATSEPYGHLLIDLSTTCHDSLRFSTRVCNVNENLERFTKSLISFNSLSKHGCQPAVRVCDNSKKRSEFSSDYPTTFLLPKKLVLQYARTPIFDDHTTLSDTLQNDYPIIPFSSVSNTSFLYGLKLPNLPTK